MILQFARLVLWLRAYFVSNLHPGDRYAEVGPAPQWRLQKKSIGAEDIVCAMSRYASALLHTFAGSGFAAMSASVDCRGSADSAASAGVSRSRDWASRRVWWMPAICYPPTATLAMLGAETVSCLGVELRPTVAFFRCQSSALLINVERHPDTTDAARRLFAALAADIARAAPRLRPLSSASRIVVKSVLLGAIALVLVLALTMLWGLALRAADEASWNGRAIGVGGDSQWRDAWARWTAQRYQAAGGFS
jgi:hypothetical protein